jgi:hypothetical protein
MKCGFWRAICQTVGMDMYLTSAWAVKKVLLVFSIEEFIYLRTVTMNLNIVAQKLWAPEYKMAVSQKQLHQF